MKKRIVFDAVVNANNAITIPEATRLSYEIGLGDILKVEIITISKDKKGIVKEKEKKA